MGLNFGALNLDVNPGSGGNEELYHVPGVSPTLLQVGVDYHETYNNLAPFSDRELGPAEQDMDMVAFLNSLPDGSNEQHNFRAQNR